MVVRFGFVAMKSVLYFLLYNIWMHYFVQSAQIYNDLATFCSNEGLVYVSLTTTDEKPMLQKEAVKAFTKLEKGGLRTRRLSYRNLQRVLDFNLDQMIQECID